MGTLCRIIQLIFQKKEDSPKVMSIKPIKKPLPKLLILCSLLKKSLSNMGVNFGPHVAVFFLV